MSTQRGNTARTRAQKHKNRTAFRNDLHDKTPQQKRLNTLHVSEVCQHCKGVIEWKIKYKKYKALTQAKTCTRCQQRNILKAYHVLCRGCAREARVCAKCLKSAEEVEIEPAQPSVEEEQKLKAEMDRLIKSLPERKRRAFLRYMKHGKEDKSEGPCPVQEEDELSGDEIKPLRKKRLPYTKDELLAKIEQLKLATEENDDLFSNSDDDGSSDECIEDIVNETGIQ